MRKIGAVVAMMLAACGGVDGEDSDDAVPLPAQIDIRAAFRESNHPDGNMVRCTGQGRGARITGLPDAPNDGSEAYNCIAPASKTDGVWIIRCENPDDSWNEYRIDDDLRGGEIESSDVAPANPNRLVECQDFFDITSVVEYR